MRVYIRFEEIVETGQVDQMQEIPYESSELDVTGMTEREIERVIADIEELMRGKKYRIYKHFCRHDEDPTTPCSIELVKEVVG